MASKFKKIVLLKGLQVMGDYEFRTIKSLLRKELKLTKKQEEYDRIQMADLLEDKFPKDAGLAKLIEVCKDVEELKDLTEGLKTEKAKVTKQKKGERKTAVKNRNQDEPSSSPTPATNNESNKNKPSSKNKIKQTRKTEVGKKRKLTEDETQLPEPSETNTQKDEGCFQTPHKPPPTTSTCSSKKKQKNTIIQKHGIIKTEVPQEKQQLPQFSATSNSSAVSELQTLQGHSTIASSNLQIPLMPLESFLALKMLQASTVPNCQNFPPSASHSCIPLNCHVSPAPFSAVKAPHEPSATASSNDCVPVMLPETVSRSLSAPQMSPTIVPSSVQDHLLPTSTAFGSTQASHSQLITSKSVKSTRGPSATLTSKSKMSPPATASSNAQVSHAPLANASQRNSATQVPQRPKPCSIQALNSTAKATVKASKNVQTHQVFLPAEANYFQASEAPPPPTSSSLSTPQVSMSTATSRVQTTQRHPGTASNCIQASHFPLPTVSRNVCTSQVPQLAASSTGPAIPHPKVKAFKSTQVPQAPSATASSTLRPPCASLPPTASALLEPRSCLPKSSRNFLAPPMSTVTALGACQATPVPPATTNSSLSRRGIVPKKPSKEEGQHQGPKQVMVLKVTEPFTYDMTEDKRMFHATVATETEFFRVKVFDTALRKKFIPQKIIIISDYFGANGFLEIYKDSCVSDVNVKQIMVISNTLRQKANETPKISHLLTQTNGTFVNGEFVVTKKNKRKELIYYGIEDETGKMEVVVYGRLTRINCEPGNKLRLICFELTQSEDMWQLRSSRHSYMQVISAGM
nr:gamma-interferon-inducible protein 16-like isoform X1 [Meriones unguiculatus]